jgi:PD-(D/E)XK endonuclease
MRPFPKPPSPPSDHPVDVGQRNETAVVLELSRRGYHVLLPHGVNHRYDLVLDQGDEFLRVQCKTGRLRSGRIVFSTKSVRCNTKQVLTRSYDGEIDYLAVYCPETDSVYLVPAAGIARGYCALRVDPPANGQRRHINWAADHQLSSLER